MSIEAPELKTGEPDADIYYSAEGLGRMWVGTYKVAQGSAELQHDVVTLLFEDILPPDVKDDFEKMERSFVVARPIVRRIINSSSHCKYNDLPQDPVDANFAIDVADIIRDPDKRSRPTSDALLEKILARDALYTPAMKNQIPRTHGSVHGEYFSQAIRYILLDRKSPHPAIDQLFDRLRPSFTALVGNEMQVNIPVPGVTDYTAAIPKPFTLHDVVSAHLADNADDLEPIRTALGELGLDAEAVIGL